MAMSPERRHEVEAIYHAALDLPEADREPFLREACQGDQELLDEVESLLGRTALSPGSRLGPYKILDLLGAGGMGEVYRARDTRLDRTVALKVLPADLTRSPERRERFEREARAISRLSHPHICTLYDIGREGEADFLVMECLEGETLVELLKRGPLPLEEALSYAVQVADALGAAHQQGVIHRDLKPANVVLTRSGAKLLDFGLAKLTTRSNAPAAETAETMAKREVTRAGVVVGTPAYMSPEQAQGGTVDARSDVFSLGATLFEMLAGRRPFQGDSTATVLSSLLRDEPPRRDEHGRLQRHRERGAGAAASGDRPGFGGPGHGPGAGRDRSLQLRPSRHSSGAPRRRPRRFSSSPERVAGTAHAPAGLQGEAALRLRGRSRPPAVAGGHQGDAGVVRPVPGAALRCAAAGSRSLWGHSPRSLDHTLLARVLRRQLLERRVQVDQVHLGLR
jgi:serine/threonine protein kinase